MELKSFIALLCLIGAATAIPSRMEFTERCAQTCSNLAVNFNYQPGQIYEYNYEAMTKLKMQNSPAVAEGPMVRLSAKAQVVVVDDCNMMLQLRDVQVQGPVDRQAFKLELEASPMSFAFEDGRIKSVCPSNDDQEWAINIKKSILSALQVAPRSLTTGQQTVREQDILGDCVTDYQIQVQNQGSLFSRSQDQKIVIKKSKSSFDCQNRNQIRSALMPRVFQSAPVMSNQLTCEQVVADQIITQAKCQETNKFLPMQYSQNDAQIESYVQLQFVGMKSGVAPVARIYRAREGLLYAANPFSGRQADEQTAAAALRVLDQKTKNGLKEEAPEVYNEVVAQLSQLPASSIMNLYEKVKRHDIGSDDRVKDLFLDALSNASSEGTLTALFQIISRKDISETRATYYFVKMTLFNEPDERALEAALRLIDGQNKPNRQALLAIASMASNLMEHRKGQPQQVVRATEVISKFVTSSDEYLAIAACKALETIGWIPKGQARQVLLQVATGHSTRYESVQAAAIAALYEVAYERDVKQTMMQIFKDQSKKAEIRIAAYRNIMKMPETSDMQEVIRHLENQERSSQVGSFVVSHFKNLKESSDPEKRQAHEMAKKFDIKKKFPSDFRKFSYNTEWSANPKFLQSGGVYEANVIYNEQQTFPTYVEFNMTAFVADNQLNLVEMGLRQENLEQGIQQYMDELSKKADASIPEMIKALAQKVMKDDEQTTYKTKNAKRSGYQYNKDVKAHAYLNLGGKTIVVIAKDDFEMKGNTQFINWEEIMEQFLSGKPINKATAFQLAQTSIKVPTVTGLPIHVETNVTGMASFTGMIKSNLDQILKAQRNPSADVQVKLNPSFAIQMATRFGMEGQRGNKQGVKVVSTLFSNPWFNLDAKLRNNQLRAGINFPEKEMTIFKADSRIFSVDSNGKEHEIKSSKSYDFNTCTQKGQKTLGLQMCAQVQAPKPFLNMQTPLLPLNGPMVAEITLRKKDQGIKSFEVLAEASTNQAQNMVYRLQFNTPGSNYNRLHKVEAHVAQNPRTGQKDAKFELRTPKKQMTGQMTLKNSQDKMALTASTNMDGKKQAQIDAAVEKVYDNASGRMEYRPQIRFHLPGQKKTQQASGKVVIQQGRKQQIQVQLKAGQNNQHQMSATIAKDGQCFGSNCAFTYEVRMESPKKGSAQAHGQIQKDQKTFLVEADVAHQSAHRSSKRQAYKVSTKIDNLSTAAASKVVFHFQAQSPTNPKKNVQATYNVMYQPGQQMHVEQELRAKWGSNSNNKDKQIHCLALAKKQASGPRSQIAAAIEGAFNCQVGPLDVDVEANVAARLQKGSSPKWYLEVQAKNNNKPQKQNLHALANYELTSRRPLKVAMAVQLETPKMKYAFRDQVVETSPNEYQGKTQLQWAKNKQATMQYRVSAKTRGVDKKIGVEAMLQAPEFQAKHSSLIEINPQNVQIKCETQKDGKTLIKMTASTRRGQNKDAQVYAMINRNNQYEIQAQINADSQKLRMSAQTKKNGKQYNRLQLNAQSNSMAKVNRMGELDYQVEAQLETKKNQYQQEVQMKLSPSSNKLQAYAQTKKNGQQLLKVNLQALARQPAQTEAKFQFQYQDPKKRSSNMDHETDIKLNDGKLQIQSSTQLNGRRLYQGEADAEMELSNQGFQANGKAQLQTKSDSYKAQGEARFDQRQTQLLAKVQENGKQIGHFQAQYQNGKSSFDAAYKTAKAQGLYDEQNDKAAFEMNCKCLNLAHKSEASWKNGHYRLQSETDKTGKRFANILVDMKKKAESMLKFELPQWQLDLEAKYNWLLAKFNGKLRNRDLEYVCDMDAEQGKDHFNFMAHNMHRGQKKNQFEAQMSRRSHSILRLETPRRYWRAEVNPFESKKSLAVEYKTKTGPQTYHKTQILAKPDRSFIQVQTQHSTRGKQLWDIDALLDKSARSTFKYSTPARSAAFECDRFSPKARMAEITYKTNKRQQHDHYTRVEVNPRLGKITIKSRHDQRSQPWASLDADLNRGAASIVKFQAKSLNGNLDCNPYGQRKACTIEVRGSKNQHKTIINLAPRNKQFVIKTVHQRRGQNYINLDAELNGQTGPSYMNWEHPYTGAANFQLTPFGKNKNVLIEVNGPHRQHKTVINVMKARNGHKVTIQTKHNYKNSPYASFDAELNRRSASNLLWDLPRSTGSLNVDPFSATKVFSLKAEGRRQQHETQVHYDSLGNKLVIKTKQAKKNQAPYAALNAYLNHRAESNLDWEYPTTKGSLVINPYGSNKVFTIKAQGRRQQHQTQVQIDSRGKKMTIISTQAKIDQLPYMKLNAALNRRAASTFELEHPRLSGSLIVDPFSSKKVYSIQANTRRHQHNTKVEFDPLSQQLTVKTSHVKGKVPYITLDADLNRQAASNLEWYHPRSSGSLIVNPFGSQKVFVVKAKGLRQQHETHVQIDSRGKKMTILSSQAKIDDLPYMTLNANLNRRAESTFNWEHPRTSGSLIVKPFGSQKVFVVKAKGLRQQHNTEIQFNRKGQMIIKSTQAKNDQAPYALLNAELNRRAASKAEWQYPAYTGSILVNPFGNKKVFTVQAKGRRQEHQTEVHVDRATGKVVIKTRQAKNNQLPYMTLDADLNRQAASNIEWTHPIYSGSALINPFGAQKVIKIQARGSQKRHQTEIQFDRLGQKVTIKTRQAKGENAPYMTLDADLNRRAVSNVEWKHPRVSGTVIVDPTGSNKVITINANGRQQQHKTVIRVDRRNKMIISTRQAKKNQAPHILLDAALNRYEPSSMDWESPLASGSVYVNPFGQNKVFSVKANGRRQQHQTEIKFDRLNNKLIIKSTQAKDNQAPWASLDADMNRYSASSMEWNHPRTSGSLLFNPYGDNKAFTIQAQGERKEHQTKIHYDAQNKRLIIQSRQAKKNQTPYMSLNADLSPEDASVIDLLHPKATANLNIQPYGSQKSFEFRSKSASQEHQTKINLHKNKVVIESRHDYRRRPYAFNAEWNRAGQSKVAVKVAHSADGQIIVNPFASERQFQMQWSNGKNGLVSQNRGTVIYATGKNGRIQIRKVKQSLM